MPNATIVDVDVIVQGALVDRAGFSTILVCGQNAPVAAIPEGSVKRYGIADFASEMALDGWLGSEPEYLAVAQIASQTFQPPEVLVGHVPAFQAKVTNVLITANADGTYWLTIEAAGQTETYKLAASGLTITQIRDQLKALVDGGGLTDFITTANVSTDQFTVTSDNAGQDHTVTAGGNQAASITVTVPTPNIGYYTALADFDLEDANWFGLYGVDAADHHIVERARYAEATRRLHGANSTDVLLLDPGSTDDIGAYLKARSYRHTRVTYHPTASEHIEAATLGNRLAIDPDVSATVWYGVTLVGVAVQGLTTAQQAALEAKNVNHYNLLGGAGFTSPGKQASGLFSDVIVTVGWLKARLTEQHVARLLEYSNAGKKLPYTDDGINVIEGDVRRQIARGIAIAHISPGTPDDEDDPVPSFSFPTRAQSLAADRQARLYRYEAQCAGAGAIFNIHGNVYLTQ